MQPNLLKIFHLPLLVQFTTKVAQVLVPCSQLPTKPASLLLTHPKVPKQANLHLILLTILHQSQVTLMLTIGQFLFAAPVLPQLMQLS